MERRDFLKRQGNLFAVATADEIRESENARRRQARANKKGAGISRAHRLAELGILEVYAALADH